MFRFAKEVSLLFLVAAMITTTPFITFAKHKHHKHPSAPPSGPCIPCEEIQEIDFGPNVMITSATLRDTFDPIQPGEEPIPAPEHCEVKGVRFFDAFTVKLPTAWNGRYYQTGNGGAAGSIDESSINSGVQMAYASAGGSGGHTQPFPMFTWAYPPGDPIAQQKLNDYCDGSVHYTSLLAKKIAKAYYCREPKYSYYDSCSTGGRQGLIEAQRYPEDFDGLLVGAPVHYLTQITTRDVWNWQTIQDDGNIPIAKLPLLADTVMRKCDSIDGLVDGLIDDPRNCDFNAFTDLPACPGDVEAGNCFTLAQREAIYKLYDGPRSACGDLLTWGEPFGSEHMVDGSSGWLLWIIPTPPAFGGMTLGSLLGGGFCQWAGLPPSEGGGPGWDLLTFDWETDFETVVENMADLCDADDPDLREFMGFGGKIIHYDGWADQATGPYQTIDYYNKVLDFMGERATNKFYKLYMIPGMLHCGGGLGCFDKSALFAALVDWVEKGVEPASYTGSRDDGGRTRPICPYPEVARYLGEGSIDESENFTCVDLMPAKVRIMPETLTLPCAGTFTAHMTFPEGYNLREWESVAVVCEGAPAEEFEKFRKIGHFLKTKLRMKGGNLTKEGDTYIARFVRQDLINIAPGDEVAFTVTAIFEHRGQRIAFEGSDVVRVTD